MLRVTVVIAAEGRRRASCRRRLDPEEGIVVVGEAETAREARRAVAHLRPGVLLLDFTRARLDVLANLPGIRRGAPSTKVLLLTRGRMSDALILEALLRGARGYLSDAATPVLLPRAIRAICAGEAWVPRRMVPKILDRLTAVEQRVWRPPARGLRVRRGRPASRHTSRRPWLS